jgi:hypothetical protein
MEVKLSNRITIWPQPLIIARLKLLNTKLGAPDYEPKYFLIIFIKSLIFQMTRMCQVKWLTGEELVTLVKDMIYSTGFDVPKLEPNLYEK